MAFRSARWMFSTMASSSDSASLISRTTTGTSWILELIFQLLIGGRLLDGVQVGALDVLDDGELQRFRIADLTHDHRHVVDLGTDLSVADRRSPPRWRSGRRAGCSRRWRAPAIPHR